MDHVRLFIYGDHLGDKVKALQRASTFSRTRPVIKDFLARTTDSLKDLTLELTAPERERLGSFSDLEDVATSFQSSEAPSEAASFALTIAAQVAELLYHCSNDHTILGPPGHEGIQHFGVCLGLLTACLSATASSIDEVSSLGIELVGVAFRLGLACQRRSHLIEDSPKSWARTFLGIRHDAIKESLDAVNKNLPSYSHASLGVVTDEWTTVFAPPATLARLDAEPDLSKLLSSTPKASSYVHAPHLPALDIDHVLGSASSLEAPFSRKKCVAPLSEGHSRAVTLREALQCTIFAIASQALYLEQVAKAVAERMSDCVTVDVVGVGPSTHSSLISRILQEGASNVVVSEIKVASPSRNEDSDSIAIVGMSGRFPHAESLEEFWSLLESGLAVHDEIPSSRFSVKDWHNPLGEGKNTTATRFGCFLKHPGLFDNWFFNISPKEAMQLDPLQRMLLMATYEALQQAGYSPNSTPSTQTSRIATFFGQTSSDWETINEQQGIGTHYISGTNRAFTPGRLNHFFQWGGGYYSIDTACSASSTSMHLASNALLARECDTAIVGGGQLCAVPDMFAGLSSGGFLSSTGACKTFADDADGYCRGEAVGVVVLKRLSDAIRENDNVLAVIRGSARNTNGVHGSIVSPHQPAQEALFQKVLRQSNVRADEITYVEMHGTGTQAGDVAEMESVMNIFSRSIGTPLHVGAVKAAIGHSEAAAGIVALIKTVLMLQKGSIPQQPDQPFALNRHLRSLEKANIVIPGQTLPWDAPENHKRIALINGFDAAGGNTSILLEEGRALAPATADPRNHHVVAISGHTQSALQANKQMLRSHLLSHPDIRLCDLSYTTTARRIHEGFREAHAVDSLDSLAEALDPNGQSQPARAARPAAKNVAFLFTGQSSQYAGMGSVLYQTSTRFRDLLDSYQTVCSGLGLPRFIDMIRGLLGVTIATTAQHHLSIVALEIALAKFWISLGIRPDVVIGHSLGEYAALCVAGVLSISSALHLVHKRAELMDAKCMGTEHGMLVTALSGECAREQIEKHGWRCEVACLNSPSSTVLSGGVADLASVEAELKAKGVTAVPLKVQYGYHSEQLDLILDDFEQIAENVRFESPRLPVASTCTGKLVTGAGTFNASYLRAQTRRPVDFVGTVRACETEGLLTSTTFVLEVGPHPVCQALLPSCISSAPPSCFSSLQRGKDDWQTVSQTLAGAYSANLPIDWTELHKDFRDSVRLIHLPTYVWDLTDFWRPYQTKPEVPAAPSITAPISPSVQRLESLRREDSSLTAVFLSNTSEPVLYQAIQGHTVSGVAICPASVFADMAYTTARFLYEKEGPNVELTEMQLQDLKMIQALPVPVKDIITQIIRITAILDVAEKKVSVRFQSVDGATASGIVDHGHATIVANDKSASQRHWAQMRRLVQGRATSLAQSPQAHRMTTALLYKLFASVVDYAKPYQALREAHVDESFQDATAIITLESAAVAKLGDFTYSPFILDALVHLAGFLLNADLNKTDNDLHMANTIGSLHILQPLGADHRSCVVYASIRDHDARTGVSLCDVFVFDQMTGAAVALCSDIRFQQLPPEVFSALVLRKPEHEPKTIRPAAWTPETTPAQPASRASSRPAKKFSRSEVLLGLTADELGIDVNTFQPDTEFESIGLHSMATLKIMAAFKKQTDLELPAGIFAENGTVGRLKAVLHDVLEDEEPEEPEAPAQLKKSDVPVPAAPTPAKPAGPIPVAEMVASAPSVLEDVYTGPWRGLPANSGPIPDGRVVLVQGDRSSTLPPLFMATAGIGLAAPYIRFPRLAKGRPIYALESPFVECPELHPHSAESISEAWIRSIKKIARKGPYIIGGYSAGGAFAYEIARQLAAAGDAIAGLLIIDCRVPQPVPAAFDIIAIPVNATGLTPKNKAHMIAGARTLVRFDPQPFEPGTEPARTHVIWGEGGESNGGYGRAAMQPVGQGRPSRELTFDEYQTELNRWFCGDREKEDFDTNGWERFVGGKERMRVHSVPGNHSSMMRPPQVKRVGEVVVEFIEDVARVEAEMMGSTGAAANTPK